MAGLVIIPRIHLTQRAVDWLTRATSIMTKDYQTVAGVPACLHKVASTERDSAGRLIWARLSPHTATAVRVMQDSGMPWGPWDYYTCASAHDMDQKVAHQEWCTGVGQVRAMYLNSDKVFVARPTKPNTPTGNYGQGRFVWRTIDILMPTCSPCRVLLDQALETAVPKYGQYPTAINRHGQLTKWETIERPQPNAAAQAQIQTTIEAQLEALSGKPK